MVSVFERGAAIVFGDYKAEAFWVKYIEFEMQQKEFKRVSKIYAQALSQPAGFLDEMLNRFHAFAAAHTVEELIVEPEDSASETKEDIMKRRDAKFRESQVLKSSREAFEAQILRPYFHVQPLDVPELAAW